MDFGTRGAVIASYFCHSTVANRAHDQRRGEEDEGKEGSSEDQEPRIVRLLIGIDMLHGGAARPMLLAQLLCERLEEGV